MSCNEPKVGEIIEFIDDGVAIFKMWTGTEWNEIKLADSSTDDFINVPKINLYDINKQAISKMPEMNAEQIKMAMERVYNFSIDKENTYYMMLNNELHYYTLFRLCGNGARIEEEVVACANALGQIKSIDLTEDESAIEIWITNEEDTYVYYFFPYDMGVIECQ